MRTRVGYAGGKKPDPTYHNIQDHIEMLQIEYDPSQIAYEELLEIFWETHNPTLLPYSRQYMSALLYHNEMQKERIVKSREAYEIRTGRSVVTEVAALNHFYSAEGYHQKYYLQNRPGIGEEVRSMYPDFTSFVDSTTAARLNGYIAGKGNREDFEREIKKINLSQKSEKQLRDLLEMIW